MRTAELAKVAANAEKLRLQTLAKRQAMRGVFGAVAALFGLGVLILLHVLGYQLLRRGLGPVASTLVLLAVDLVIVIVCGVLALRSAPSTVEQEAEDIRRQALREMRTTMTVMGMIGPATRLLGGRRSTGLALGALATRLLTRR